MQKGNMINILLKTTMLWRIYKPIQRFLCINMFLDMQIDVVLYALYAVQRVNYKDDSINMQSVAYRCFMGCVLLIV